uniref:Uncharacterized protein n=1 Tax=Candidatus Kentrum sp. TC TaxID=2126339 RepID=A0A450ZFL6_9GAMM|nr:MAG: hypothetical protein BECKTC1821D_GA0114238_11914 [Candidatus Kentron sp. TC]
MATVRAILRDWPVLCVRYSYPVQIAAIRVGTMGADPEIPHRESTMKNPKELPSDLISPVVKPNEVRQRMRKLENALHSASEAIREAKEEYQYLVYGVEDISRWKRS